MESTKIDLKLEAERYEKTRLEEPHTDAKKYFDKKEKEKKKTEKALLKIAKSGKGKKHKKVLSKIVPDKEQNDFVILTNLYHKYYADKVKLNKGVNMFDDITGDAEILEFKKELAIMIDSELKKNYYFNVYDEKNNEVLGKLYKDKIYHLYFDDKKQYTSNVLLILLKHLVILVNENPDKNYFNNFKVLL